MSKIYDTSLNISLDVVLNQTIRINSRNWGRDSRTIIFNELDNSVQNYLLDILQAGRYIELSRKEIFDTEDICSKIIKILMWGYPRGTTNQAVGNNNGIHIILTRLNDCCSHLAKIKDRDFESSEEFLKDTNISFLIDLKGVGVSTLSKLLYRGTIDQFQKINIGIGNNVFNKMPIEFNYNAAK